MKKLSIAAASTLALGLAFSSLPAQAQKPISSATTPGGSSGIQAASNAVSGTTQTIMLIEQIQTGTKSSATAAPTSNTYRLEPTGVQYSGPVRLCLKYAPGADKAKVGAAISSALTTMLKEVKNKNGAATYKRAPGDPVDDTLNSLLCVQLVDN